MHVPYAFETAPAYLKSCPVPPAIPEPPKKPRTIDGISDWGNAENTALRQAIQDVWECDGRRAELLRILDAK
jgi:hypothetical protein